MPIFLFVLLILNAVTFFLFAFDKHCSIHNKRRVPERILFLLAFLGGALGAIIAMQVFRHKTKKTIFVVMMPLLFVIHLILIFYIFPLYGH